MFGMSLEVPVTTMAHPTTGCHSIQASHQVTFGSALVQRHIVHLLQQLPLGNPECHFATWLGESVTTNQQHVVTLEPQWLQRRVPVYQTA